jgi:predicted metalloprotease with PDZ domain
MRLLFTLSLLLALQARAQAPYQYTVDLTNVVDDKVKVTLQCPPLKEDAAVFVLPRVIPGSYAWKEYGRFLSDVRAFDAQGNPLKVTNKKNLFSIPKGAGRLARLEYWVSDTWDDDDLRNFVFQAGGSNIEAGNNFVLNHHAFLGYFEGYKRLPFRVEVVKPAHFYGSTWLPKESVADGKDVITAENYDLLVDNPVMYCKADTASFTVDGTRIVVSAYSGKGVVKADSVREWLRPLAAGLHQFLGKLPVPEYHFLFYFAGNDQLPKGPTKGGLSGFGALEHNHCSFYFLPEMTDHAAMREMVQDVGAHEFLHILTPLNLHSKEIEDFNFREPTMSQHLWLYEGVTEYFSWLARVQSGMVTEEAFMKEMTRKLIRAGQYGDFSMTEMSKNVLRDSYQAKYPNVYQKGAVLAMLLDQTLLAQSGGRYGLKHLVTDLMRKYGEHRAFDDAQLFADMVALTGPQTETFINNYIRGSQPLPLAGTVKAFGYTYTAEQRINAYFVASMACKLNADNQVEVGEVLRDFIGLRPGDVLLAVNDLEITPQTFSELWEEYFQYNLSPADVRLKIRRNGRDLVLNGKPMAGYALRKHAFQRISGVWTEDTELHEAWLKGKYLQ